MGGVQQYSVIASDSRFFGSSLRTTNGFSHRATDVIHRHVERSEAPVSTARARYASSYKEVA